MKTDAEITAALVEELQSLAAPMEVVMKPDSVFALVALYQLALRHPDLSEHSAPRAAGQRFVSAAREYFANCPTVLEIIRRGDDTQEDR